MKNVSYTVEHVRVKNVSYTVEHVKVFFYLGGME